MKNNSITAIFKLIFIVELFKLVKFHQIPDIISRYPQNLFPQTCRLSRKRNIISRKPFRFSRNRNIFSREPVGISRKRNIISR